MIELRQQVEVLRREPLNIDRIYRDGRAMGIVGRFGGALIHLSRRMAASEAARLLEEVNAVRAEQGDFEPCKGVIQPTSTKRLQELRKRIEKG